MNINQFLDVVGQQSIDGKKFKLEGVKHRPYASASEVLLTIRATRRHVGQEFAVANGAAIETWHFLGGIADSNLVKKGEGSWNFRGSFSPISAYAVKDVVTYQGNTFLSLDNNTGVIPVDGPKWAIIADGTSSVLEFNDFEDLPDVGTENTLYITNSNNKQYRWDKITNAYALVGEKYDDNEIRQSLAKKIDVVSNVKQAVAELPNLMIGETFRDLNSQGEVKLLDYQIGDYIQQQNDGSIYSRFILKDPSHNGGKTFAAGTKWSAYINVEKTVPGASWIMGFSGPDSGIFVSASSVGSSTYSIVTGVGSPSVVIKNVNGVERALTNLQMGRWYYVEVTLTQSHTIRQTGDVDDGNIRGVNLTYTLLPGTIIKLAGLTLRGERFTIDSESGTMVGGNGSIFFSRPESDPSIFGSLTDILDNRVVFSNGDILEILPKNGVVTPQMYGYVTSLNKDVNNDASDYLQACFDSDFNVYIPPGMYYLSKPVYIRKGKSIRLPNSRISINTVDGTPLSPEPSSCFIWSDQNINFIYFQSGHINWSGGCIDTFSVPSHNKAAILVDANYRIEYCSISNLCVQGKIDTVKTVGGGTKGIYVDLNVNPGSRGYVMANHITDVFGVYIDSVIKVSSVGSNWTPVNGNFINSFTIDIEGHGCKEYVSIHGGNSTVRAWGQDWPILADEEVYLAPFTILGDGNMIDVFCFDQDYGSKSSVAPHRHIKEILVAPGQNQITGRSYNYVGTLGSTGFGHANSNIKVNNPPTFYHSSVGRVSVISDLNNEIRYGTDYGRITYKGYGAPNDSWFDANLKSATDVQNPTPLTEDPSACVVNYPNQLLSSEDNSAIVSRHTIKKQFGFAEVVISGFNSKFTSLQVTLGGTYGGTPPTGNLVHKKLQVIYETDSGTVSQMILPDQIVFKRGSFTLPTTLYNVNRVIIRFIGAGVLNETIELQDISIRTLGTPTPPVLDISKRTQRKLGLMVFEKSIADGALVDDPKSYLEVVSDITDFNHLDYSATLYLNNTSGSNKTITLSKTLSSAGLGAEFTLIATESSRLSMVTDSADITIMGDLIKQDGKYGFVVLKKGEWVKIKKIDRGEAGTRSWRQYIVVAQGKKPTLDTAPASSTDSGIAGERRFAADGVYVCIADNTWRKIEYNTF